MSETEQIIEQLHQMKDRDGYLTPLASDAIDAITRLQQANAALVEKSNAVIAAFLAARYPVEPKSLKLADAIVGLKTALAQQ